MLAEYVLNPDIFDSTCYDSPELCSVHLQHLKQVILEEALVRNLYDGAWLDYLRQCAKRDEYCWPSRSKELIKKLIKQNRLRTFPSVLGNHPDDYATWCMEALASHDSSPLNGIITTRSLAEEFDADEISAIDKLASAKWWQGRSPSVRLRRTSEDYIRHLQLVLGHANSIMFIDPYLDPVRSNYREFFKLLAAITKRDIPPAIEIHRACYFGSGATRQDISQEEMERDFSKKLSDTIRENNLTIDVFVWDRFHDRYLISNVIGINLNNGFDISGNSTELTTWTRLGRLDRDDIQREFDPASGQHKLQYQFTLS